MAEILSRLLPKADVSVILGAGHMSPFSHRDTVTRLIVEHVEGFDSIRRDGRTNRSDLDSGSMAALMES